MALSRLFVLLVLGPSDERMMQFFFFFFLVVVFLGDYPSFSATVGSRVVQVSRRAPTRSSLIGAPSLRGIQAAVLRKTSAACALRLFL